MLFLVLVALRHHFLLAHVWRLRLASLLMGDLYRSSFVESFLLSLIVFAGMLCFVFERFKCVLSWTLCGAILYSEHSVGLVFCVTVIYFLVESEWDILCFVLWLYSCPINGGF